MWPDNETSEDLLGFKVHSDLIKEVVTDPTLLPVVMGVFGDWGGGKSSIMKMLQEDLESGGYEDVVCLYFNGWMFEGYEDAKSALLTSILVQLGEHKRLALRVKDKVTGLLRRVQWMEVGKLALKRGILPLGVAAVTGGHTGWEPAMMSALPHLLSAHDSGTAEEKDKGEKSKERPEKDNWLDKLVAAPGKPDLLEVRKFREEFEQMLAETGIRSLVVLIDDLDRCLPERLIDTLEAIKLFVAVPRTAFVIGADPRIVQHAISTRYARQELGRDASDEEEYDLTRDYLEKLIQIPYHLPRLSPSEMESYVNLLLCKRHLDDTSLALVYERAALKRQDDFYTPFGHGDVQVALGGQPVPPSLTSQLSWSGAVALSITEGLKGNPRQVKRLLNAMVLRTKLAKIAKLEIRDDVLAKLMVLEYTMPARFRELDQWQTAAKGFPEPLAQLEAEMAEVRASPTDDALSEWRKLPAKRWLEMEPALNGVDLRDYFWVARDRTKSTLTTASMMSPHIRNLFRQLIGDNQGEQRLAVTASAQLGQPEQESLLEYLVQHIVRQPGEDEPYEALRLLSEANVDGAPTSFITAVRKVSAEGIAASAPAKLALLIATHPARQEEIISALTVLQQKPDTIGGRAAGVELRRLSKPRQR